MNCGQTASIPQSGQNEFQHHDLPIQNCLVRGDGSTDSLRQVDMLIATDKLLLSVLMYCDSRVMQILLRLLCICKPSGGKGGRCCSNMLALSVWVGLSRKGVTQLQVFYLSVGSIKELHYSLSVKHLHQSTSGMCPDTGG